MTEAIKQLCNACSAIMLLSGRVFTSFNVKRCFLCFCILFSLLSFQICCRNVVRLLSRLSIFNILLSSARNASPPPVFFFAKFIVLFKYYVPLRLSWFYGMEIQEKCNKIVTCIVLYTLVQQYYPAQISARFACHRRSCCVAVTPPALPPPLPFPVPHPPPPAPTINPNPGGWGRIRLPKLWTLNRYTSITL